MDCAGNLTQGARVNGELRTVNGFPKLATVHRSEFTVHRYAPRDLNYMMTRRRFYAPPENFDRQSVALDAEEARHLRDALRLRAGDEAFVFDGAGREFRCVVAEKATLNLLEEVAPAQPESPLALTLGAALLKGEKFDLVVQKATELGVARVMPLVTQRADVRDGARRVERWRRVALAAAKQAGRAVVPEIAECANFADVLAQRWPARVMFAERGGAALPLTQATAACALVGPEGGWADEEIAAARDEGWQIVTLGGRILRAETAALVAVTLLQHHLGDLR
jgi:16S rRNA (uracil1498-N3)-methyltransferase